jgi:hypothetical protein
MPTNKFRFGKLREDIEDYAVPADLDGEIEHDEYPLVEERDEHQFRRGSRDPHYEPSDSEHGTEFFYFRYVAEKLDMGVGLGDDGEDEDREMVTRDTMDFLLLPDGRFAYQSGDDVGPGNAMEVLFESIPEYESDADFSNNVVRNFYEDNEQVGKVEISGFDTDGIAEPESEVTDAVSEAGRVADTTVFKTGFDQDANVKESRLINEFVSQAEVSEVGAVTGAENAVTISDNNWIEFYYQPDLQAGVRGRTIHRRVRSVLNDVIES